MTLIQQIVKLNGEGKVPEEIAKQMGICKDAVREIVTSPLFVERGNLRRIAMEARSGVKKAEL